MVFLSGTPENAYPFPYDPRSSRHHTPQKTLLKMVIAPFVKGCSSLPHSPLYTSGGTTHIMDHSNCHQLVHSSSINHSTIQQHTDIKNIHIQYYILHIITSLFIIIHHHSIIIYCNPQNWSVEKRLHHHQIRISHLACKLLNHNCIPFAHRGGIPFIPTLRNHQRTGKNESVLLSGVNKEASHTPR